MTRKDYILIAEAIKHSAPRLVMLHGDFSGLDVITDNVADALQQDNPNFDRARFLRACGLEV